jgi:hypothetical protein
MVFWFFLRTLPGRPGAAMRDGNSSARSTRECVPVAMHRARRQTARAPNRVPPQENAVTAASGATEQPMEWDFEFLPQLGILSVRTAGDLDYERMLDFIEAAAAAMQRHGVDRILVDHRDAVLKLSPTKVYRLPAVEVAYGLGQRSRVAVVLSVATARDEDAQIYEGVMRSNGLPHRLFRDPDAALAWLLDRGPGA